MGETERRMTIRARGFRSKYEGKCCVCGGDYQISDRIVPIHTRWGTRYIHHACYRPRKHPLAIGGPPRGRLSQDYWEERLRDR